ncbi:MAG: SEC-C domain-containing protein [Clostridiales Family XIII bacterium]|jgi:preprotein translocase subunit SecA|nr:SEC-C domain-containing protein [Clostridiales Family XIII bacterium]
MSNKSYQKQWETLLEGQDESTFKKFWEEYCDAEIKLYTALLSDENLSMQGKFSDLVAKYEVDKILFMGFLDGIDSSLKEHLDLPKIDDDSEVNLHPDPELLYHNMLNAEAEHLYTLPEWETVLEEDTREAIYNAYRRSKTVIKEKTPGRNDPCPCGSGKKYKKCCGATSA